MTNSRVIRLLRRHPPVGAEVAKVALIGLIAKALLLILMAGCWMYRLVSHRCNDSIAMLWQKLNKIPHLALN